MKRLSEKIIEELSFDWDDANLDKNRVKHDVEPEECEEVFFNVPLLLSHDMSHSITEPRYQALGKTHTNRLLFIAFTKRKNKIRIISARNQTPAERRTYEKA